MKKGIFFLLSISILAHAEHQQTTMLSSAASWLANHKLGIAGLTLMGGGFLARCFIHDFEKKRLDRYNRMNPVKSEVITKEVLVNLINKKIETSDDWHQGLGKTNNNFVVFEKNTFLGKFIKDKIELQGDEGKTVTVGITKTVNNGKNTVSVIYIGEQLQITHHPREIRCLEYADSFRIACIGIGAVAGLKSFVFDYFSYH
ncbi:hypothetical protein HYX58_02875 [Candidatus Dependentiae bacterium]|nr:hypothetical protein [Candidatus Dependentiae bacterium]